MYIDGTIGSWNVSRLGNNIGHLEGTSWLPDDGNVVLSGHVELAGGERGIFANLHELTVGERVVIQHDGVDYHYDIVSVGITEPTDLAPLYPTNDGINRLTLITCGSYDFLSNSYLERVIVVAEQVSGKFVTTRTGEIKGLPQASSKQRWIQKSAQSPESSLMVCVS